MFPPQRRPSPATKRVVYATSSLVCDGHVLHQNATHPLCTGRRTLGANLNLARRNAGVFSSRLG